MSKGPRQVFGKGHIHFITCFCYRRQQKLAVEKHRNLFVHLLEEVRVKFRFGVMGYAVMPDHFNMLMAEPAVDTPGNAMEVLLRRYQRRYNTSVRSEETTWALPYTDEHIYEPERLEERLNFMHQQPVKVGLVETAIDWEWSSARSYAGLPEGIVTIQPASLGTKSGGRASSPR